MGQFSEALVHGDGEAPNLLIDLREIGSFVARIIDDERTLNKYVVCYGDVLSENQIFSTLEELSGEKLKASIVSLARAVLMDTPANDF